MVRQGHKRTKPGQGAVGVEGTTLGQGGIEPAVALHLLAIACDFLGDDILNVAGADAGLLHRGRIGADMDLGVLSDPSVGLEAGRDLDDEGELAFVHRAIDLGRADGLDLLEVRRVEEVDDRAR